MNGIRVHLTFPEEQIKEPLIYNLGKNYGIVTNIRRANVEQKMGWVMLEMEADDEALERGIKYLEDQGVQVDRMDGDVIES